MRRLSRAEQQEVTRARVLDAARNEFTEHGYRGATVDRIAERAILTRGAVYSNFPGKRALYFAVLAREALNAPPPEPQPAEQTLPATIASFARTWSERLPRSDTYEYTPAEQLSSPALSIDLVPEIQSEERIRRPFAELLKLDAILLGLALTSVSAPGSPTARHFIRVAESVLTILFGATQLSFAAPGFLDPAGVVAMCEQIAVQTEPYSPPSARVAGSNLRAAVDEIWSPPACYDMVTTRTVQPDGNRIVAILGLNKISAIEDALVDSAPSAITLALVTSDPTGELTPLARLALADFTRSLRHAFPASALPPIQVIIDESGALAAACGVHGVDDDTEAAVGIRDGRITIRAQGRGSCQALTDSNSASSVET